MMRVCLFNVIYEFMFVLVFKPLYRKFYNKMKYFTKLISDQYWKAV